MDVITDDEIVDEVLASFERLSDADRAAERKQAEFAWEQKRFGTDRYEEQARLERARENSEILLKRAGAILRGREPLGLQGPALRLLTTQLLQHAEELEATVDDV